MSDRIILSSDSYYYVKCLNSLCFKYIAIKNRALYNLIKDKILYHVDSCRQTCSWEGYIKYIDDMDTIDKMTYSYYTVDREIFYIVEDDPKILSKIKLLMS